MSKKGDQMNTERKFVAKGYDVLSYSNAMKWRILSLRFFVTKSTPAFRNTNIQICRRKFSRLSLRIVWVQVVRNLPSRQMFRRKNLLRRRRRRSIFIRLLRIAGYMNTSTPTNMPIVKVYNLIIYTLYLNVKYDHYNIHEYYKPRPYISGVPF